MKPVTLVEGRCKELVTSGWHSYQCSRKAVEDGYCKQHNPVRKEARFKATQDKWNREYTERSHQRKINSKKMEAVEVVKKIATGVEDPTETARQFIQELDDLIA